MRHSFVEVGVDAREQLGAIFAGMEKTMIWSCLQGHMGHAWADSDTIPTCAQLLVGDLVFYGGDTHSPVAQSLARHVPEALESSGMLAICADESWVSLLKQAHHGRCQKIVRYAIHKDKHDFCPDKLKACRDALPAGYELYRMDEAMYHLAMAEDWSRDLCSQFESAHDYVTRGLGYGILFEGRLVCGASSYTIYDKGIEIQIDTQEAHRRKGLATACGAAIVLECLRTGRYPSWDAANMASVHLAEKLGYHLKEAYDTYEVAGRD